MPRTIESLRNELNRLLNPTHAQTNSSRIAALEHEIENLVNQEELHWNQRSCTNWLTQGDDNNKFFHAIASERKHINHIKGLLEENGKWCVEENDIADINLKYFATLFLTSNPSDSEIETTIEYTCTHLDVSMNAILCAPYTETDIYKALFDMHPSKARL